MSEDRETFLPFAQGAGRCELCFGTGDVLAKATRDQVLCTFRCRCPAGKRSKKNFAEWPGEAAGYVIEHLGGEK